MRMRLASTLAMASAAAAVASGRRVFVVTGATDGIGRLTATKLGADGHTVAVHGRCAAKVAAVVAEIDGAGGDGRGFVADLSELAEVRRLGAEIARAFPRIDGLLNNAGTFDSDYTGGRRVTGDGNEYSLAVNVLAPFLLTSLLLESVRAAPAGRVLICVESQPIQYTFNVSVPEQFFGAVVETLGSEDEWSKNRGKRVRFDGGRYF